MTPLFKKLNYKDQNPVVILNAPESFAPEIKAMGPVTTFITQQGDIRAASFMMAFATRQQEVDTLAHLMAGHLEGDGILWMCYPKGSSKKYKCDFNRDTGWNVLAKEGFEPVRMVAIDEDWSALRFRKVQYIKKLTRSFAQTDEGKARTAKGQ